MAAVIGPTIITIVISIGMIWRHREFFLIRTPIVRPEDDQEIQ